MNESGAPALNVLYEDNHLLAVYKRAGMLSQGDLSGDLDVLTLARETIKRREHKPGNVYLGLVHRLDRPVGGVMVLAKTSKAASRLSAQFRSRETRKLYRAVVQGLVRPEQASLCHALIKDTRTNVTRVAGPGEVGKQAELAYCVLESKPERSLLEIDLKTGLPHQIRVQLAAIGHPIAGDRKYGSAIDYTRGEIALYACSIAFVHPVKRESLVIEAGPPPCWPWS